MSAIEPEALARAYELYAIACDNLRAAVDGSKAGWDCAIINLFAADARISQVLADDPAQKDHQP